MFYVQVYRVRVNYTPIQVKKGLIVIVHYWIYMLYCNYIYIYISNTCIVHTDRKLFYKGFCDILLSAHV